MTPQSGVIAYRNTEAGLRVLLIPSRRRRDRWVIPKGGLEPGLTPASSAELEAYEEAGVKGEVQADPLGSFLYRKRGNTYRVEVFLMRVDQILECWPERSQRTRVWLTTEEAASRVDEAALKSLLLSVESHAQGGKLDVDPDQPA